MNGYEKFLDSKRQHGLHDGFEPRWMPDFLHGFQRRLVEYALRRGRAAIFADCGTGKTLIEIVWAENTARETGQPVLLLAPLAVAAQTLREAERFGIEVARSTDGRVAGRITIANYERLHLFDLNAYAGIVCDESSILKNFEGKTRTMVTEALRTKRYRLLATATAAPNDYVELGTHSEAVGDLGHTDMLGRFFKNDQHSIKPNSHGKGSIGEGAKWRFKRHARLPFWRWIASWARAMRHPSDLGPEFAAEDARFVLPPLVEREHVVAARRLPQGYLFDLGANGLREEREERRRTIDERCETVAHLVAASDGPSLVWCHLNDEGDRLERMIPGAVQVAGKDPDEAKEEAFLAFAEGRIPALVTKPRIGCLGLNLQRCAHVVTFASHSYEQYYQGVRRCWRYGQTRPVVVDVVATEGEKNALENLKRKSRAADTMFSELVASMNESSRPDLGEKNGRKEEVPEWL